MRNRPTVLYRDKNIRRARLDIGKAAKSARTVERDRFQSAHCIGERKLRFPSCARGDAQPAENEKLRENACGVCNNVVGA